MKIVIAITLIITALVLLFIADGVIVMNISPGRFNADKSWLPCMSEVQQHDFEKIIVGTSVLRELTFSKNNVNDEFSIFGYNCGMSVTTTALRAHHVILTGVLSRNRKIKEVFIGISVQDILGSNKLQLDKIGVDLFSFSDILGMFLNGYIDQQLKFTVFYESLINYLFPLARFQHKTLFKPTDQFQTGRENSKFYIGKVFNKDNPQKEQVEMLTRPLIEKAVIKDLKLLESLGSKHGAKVRFVYLPQNKDFISLKLSKSAYDQLFELVSNNISQPAIDLRATVSPSGFADCCHLNDYGRKEFYRKTKGSI